MSIPVRRYWALLVDYLKPQRPRVALLAVLLATSTALQLANPQLVRHFIDTATAGGPQGALLVTALAFIGIALAGQAVAVWATYVSEIVGWTATNALRADLADHCLKLDLSFHKSRTPGEMIQRVDGDVDALSNFFAQFVIQVLSNLVLVVGVLVLLFAEDWRIGFGFTLFATITLAAMGRLHAFAVPRWTALRELMAQFYGFLGEHLAGTEDIRSSGAASHVMRRFYSLMRRWLPIQTDSWLANAMLNNFGIGLFAIGNAIAFAVSAYLWSDGAITIGTVYLVFQYTEMLRRPMDQIRNQLQELQSAGASIGRVEELFGTNSKIEDGPGAPLPHGPLSLEFRDVSFGYDEGEAVLKGVTLRLAPGRILGVLGRTGSGKTTLARLALRLYDADSGEIALGGVPVRDARLSDLRRRVAAVTQDVQVFNATIRDNLTFFDHSISDDRLVSALEDLGLSDWYRSLPEGLATKLGPDGSLSAGQAQLLALARVFLSDPGLVLLDEASSRLDPATERLIDRAVQKLLENRTGLVIAHRLATLERVDELVVLEDGEIIEQGQREQLAADANSHYSRLRRAGLEAVLA